MPKSALSPLETIGFELSAQQKRLWRLKHAESRRTTGVIRIEDHVDITLLERALDRVVDHYEVLRTTLHAESSRRYPLQVVGAEPQITWNITARDGDCHLLRIELSSLFADF